MAVLSACNNGANLNEGLSRNHEQSVFILIVCWFTIAANDLDATIPFAQLHECYMPVTEVVLSPAKVSGGKGYAWPHFCEQYFTSAHPVAFPCWKPADTNTSPGLRDTTRCAVAQGAPQIPQQKSHNLQHIGLVKTARSSTDFLLFGGLPFVVCDTCRLILVEGCDLKKARVGGRTCDLVKFLSCLWSSDGSLYQIRLELTPGDCRFGVNIGKIKASLNQIAVSNHLNMSWRCAECYFSWH